MHESHFTCSDSSVLRRSEEVALRNKDGRQPQYTHNYQVDEAGLRGAVEGVVEPGDEGAHDEEGDAAVVQPEGHRFRWTTCSFTWPLQDTQVCSLLGEDPGHSLRVAVHRVEEPGEGEAEDGAQEEHPDDHLFLDRRHERHVGPEHVHETQTEEEQTACRGDDPFQVQKIYKRFIK